MEGRTFESILQQLQEAFPEEVVRKRKINDKVTYSYIEVDHYVERLNHVAGNTWSWLLQKEPVLYDKEVLVIGTLDIMGAKRDGIGTAPLKKQNGAATNLKYAIRSASQDALRDACDLFGMGWKNLKHVKKPREGTTLSSNSPTCQKCKTPIPDNQLEWLQKNRINLYFCENCVPAHLRK
ncbi:Rad52/Rad22 family DNA repair protein [Alteribacillus bidgolensis]|uniref:Rad52/22 family double-strand break repair protein n=1 Tax=Alteribacillus bidgolensis TaxID=930129 RepID=A0A1G8RNB6_9BACI|nr:Rad52/Rad22 family DNA repair protein [Alteribacillus bidgolensis]SDJ18564.1 hypothetical protein SAMN05216352_13012 [Alteribacillus bidgolensis]